MSISFVALSISDEATKNVGPKPTGTAEDDFMLAHVWAYEEEVTVIPTGWTEIEATDTFDAGSTQVIHHYIYKKTAGASEPASYTWETTTDTGPTPNRRVVIVSYRGVFLDDPVAEERAPHTENAGSNELELQNMTQGGVGRRMVLMAAVATPEITSELGSPWVERLAEDGNFVYDRRIVVAGTIESEPLVLSSVITSWGHQNMLVPTPDEPGDRNYCQSVDVQIN